MGVNVFATCGLGKDEYKERKAELYRLLSKLYQKYFEKNFSGHQAFQLSTPPHYADAFHFRSVNFFVAHSAFEKEHTASLNAFLKHHLSLLGVSHFNFDLNAFSFVYKNALINVTHLSPEKCRAALFYFAYDLNHFIEKIAYQLGVSFTPGGLWFRVPGETGKTVDEVLLSASPEQICDFLDLDFKRFQQGFDTKEDLFWFIYQSRYFNPQIFDLEAENYPNGITRNDWLIHIGFQPFFNLLSASQDPLKEKERSKNRDANRRYFHFHCSKIPYLYLIDVAFPGADIFAALKKHSDKLQKAKEVKDRFNGCHLMRWTGLKGRELAVFIQKYKAFIGHTALGSCNGQITYADFSSYVLARSSEQLEQSVKSFFQAHYKI